jgi:hypothetical protein
MAESKICPGDDVDELGWFSPGDKLPNFAFSADRHMVERYFATRLSGAPSISPTPGRCERDATRVRRTESAQTHRFDLLAIRFARGNVRFHD